MVLISSKKYACETCIKGHRSSSCKHTERPLFEIKKKGRPVTQCSHCRELRKTKQVHVKCLCGIAEPLPPKKGSPKDLGKATFPNGLPESLETSAKSPHEANNSPTPCCCLSDADCHCWTPRKAARRTDQSGLNALVSETPSHILARVAELRPVLPRPPGLNDLPTLGGRRHQHHPDVLFSPYSRAYDNHVVAGIPTPDSFNALVMGTNANWNILAGTADDTHVSATISACSCGDGCQCYNCGQVTYGFVPTTCEHPGACIGCEACIFPAVSTQVQALDQFDNQLSDGWLLTPYTSQLLSYDVDAPSNVVCGTSESPCRCDVGPCQCGWGECSSALTDPIGSPILLEYPDRFGSSGSSNGSSDDVSTNAQDSIGHDKLPPYHASGCSRCG